MTAAVAAFRRQWRGKRRTLVSGWPHFAGILAFGAAATAAAAAMVEAPAWWEWAAIPAGFLLANLVEYLAHRWPMHRPFPGLWVMYEKHTLEHHKFFTAEAMEAESPEDFDMVLFSPPALAFFLLGTGLPIALLFFALASWNAGWIFVALAVDYYVLYECFHLAYHLPKDGLAARLPGMALLRRHHTLHHDQALMARWNFNITFPIFDYIFGTSR